MSNTEKEPKFMLFCGNYRELKLILLHNRLQFQSGADFDDYICVRCKKRKMSVFKNETRGFLSSKGTYFCSDCLEKMKDRKTRPIG